MQHLRHILQQFWGYDSFRPNQAEAMRCVLEGRDSVVVLPTGGGKSLCYQAPAMAMDGMAVVVSPLIALMKDQVDALDQCGIPAACINSTLMAHEKREIARSVRSGAIKLLYVAPERLVQERFLDFLRETPISFFAIDEAHCISMWGHDFRPEYRGLAHLKEEFPGASVHAYTATATPQVREDMAAQLGLDRPEVHVGSFVRPNLFYRVRQRGDILAQTLEVIRKHDGQSGVVYCIRRKDVEQLTADLNANGVRALAYHAGMGDDARRRSQEAFVRDEAEVIVATVAFGMGIDKPDVRYVVHTGMPKSLEHYQQESGRAGRDGLEADCVLFYGPGDFGLWKSIIGNDEAPGAAQALSAMYDFCTGMACRHRSLVEYFGQPLNSCSSCDVCAGEIEGVSDASDIAGEILGAIADTGQNFGGAYVANVLAGANEARIRERGHDRLPCHGALRSHDKQAVRSWIEQLAGQGYIERVGEYNVLQLTANGQALLRGDGDAPRLLAPDEAPRKSRSRAAGGAGWEGVDHALFDTLRELRRTLAAERGIPPYMVFGDASLRDMARVRPLTPDAFHHVRGVGDRKAAEYGDVFLRAITTHCEQHPDAPVETTAAPIKRSPRNDRRSQTFQLFRESRSIEEVCEATGRAPSTVNMYLNEYLVEDVVTDPSPWISPFLVEQIESAAAVAGTERLRDVFEHLDGEVPYDAIRIVVTCLRNRTA
ncbi:MAG: DNA helicase RecQ [Candidatus Hydrogenedens sp.]|nr:DNA helicase RecQ [Candidatus Hydrogenedens sp.]